MRCEVVAIGTELLLGQIVDSNSSWIGQQLAMNGIDSLFQTKVGDNHERIVFTLRQALERSEAVICCGGLGPTQDDITRDAIADVMGVGLELHQPIADHIRHIFESRGRTMPENNLRQAEVPVGASPIPDQPGTAPGLICPIGDKVIYAVPGVPYEMHQMMETAILPDLIRRAGLKAVIKSRVLRTWGHSESRLAEILSERIDTLDQAGNPTLAFLASGIEGLKVRITAKGDEEAAVETLLNDEELVVRELLGETVFGVDEQTMESVVIDILRQRGLTMSLCEVTSGGIAGVRLSAIDPKGDVFRGSIIPPAGSVRQTVLGVEPDLLSTPEAAKTLAEATRTVFNSDIGLAITGEHDRGEGGARGQTFLGIADSHASVVERVRLPGDRERVRQFSVISLLNALRLRLEPM